MSEIQKVGIKDFVSEIKGEGKTTLILKNWRMSVKHGFSICSLKY